MITENSSSRVNLWLAMKLLHAEGSVYSKLCVCDMMARQIAREQQRSSGTMTAGAERCFMCYAKIQT